MDQTALVVIGLAVLVIGITLLLMQDGGKRVRKADLTPPSTEARDRYLME